jgi:hypothetical protein
MGFGKMSGPLTLSWLVSSMSSPTKNVSRKTGRPRNRPNSVLTPLQAILAVEVINRGAILMETLNPQDPSWLSTSFSGQASQNGK